MRSLNRGLSKLLKLSDKTDDPFSISKYRNDTEKRQSISWRITEMNKYLLQSKDIDMHEIFLSILNRMTTVYVDLSSLLVIVDAVHKRASETSENSIELCCSDPNRSVVLQIASMLRMLGYSVSVTRHRDDFDRICETDYDSGIFKSVFQYYSVLGFALLYNVTKFFLKPFLKPISVINLWFFGSANNFNEVDAPLHQNLSRNTNFSHVYLNPWDKKSKFSHFLFSFYIPNIRIKILLKFFLGPIYFDRFYQVLVNSIFKSFHEIECNMDAHKPLPLALRFSLGVHALNSYLVYAFFKGERNVTIVFRGGNADGIVLSSLLDNTTVLLPHGTEFLPIDHNTIDYLDFIYLPSDYICKKWLTHNSALFKKLVHTGRPYYDTLSNLKSPMSDGCRSDRAYFQVGIVLTYGSQESTLTYIRDIVAAFSYANLKFCIKQRPNFQVDLTPILSGFSNVIEFEGGIYDYLSEVDLLISGASPRGVLGMTTMDAIVVGIPSIYYFGNLEAFKPQGSYSWDESMQCFSYFSAEALDGLVQAYPEMSQLLDYVRSCNYALRNRIFDVTDATERVQQHLMMLSKI